jgi:hypothetical protein
MAPSPPLQLVSYIAPGAPARRRLATGAESFLRPEIGWFLGCCEATGRAVGAERGR